MRFSSGFDDLDELLGGGYNSSEINMVYGPAASGKTTACFLAAIVVAKKGKKVLFIDTESGFSVERIKQLVGEGYEKIIENIFVLKVGSFEEQKKQFLKLFSVVAEGDFDLVIIDTLGAHYRRALKENIYGVNKEMDGEFTVLRDIAKKSRASVIVTNQVYADFKEKDAVQIVGGNMFRNWSGVLLELKKFSESKRGAVLMKSKKEGKRKKEKEIVFKIKERGFTPL